VKRENVTTKTLSDAIEFDGKTIERISFDLEHINRGWDTQKNDYNPHRRSSYTADDIVEFFEQFGFYSIEWDDQPGGSKEEVMVKGKKHYRYTAYVTDHESQQQKKIVIDIPFDFKNESIVVTVY